MMEINSQEIKPANPDLAVFTVCNIAYLPKALVLADSLLEHAHTRLNVILFDNKQDLSPYPETVDITWVEDLGLPEWKQLAFIYDIIEFSTSLKPYIALKLLEKHARVIFLDPDTAVYSSLDPILKDLVASPVVLTPHYTKPQPDTEHESDLGMMRFGSFNLGFFAVRKGSEASYFLNWWSKRCIDFCFMESQFGLSTDQKWVSIAPCFFDFLKISFNPGYNAAPWNTFERMLTEKNGDQYMVNTDYPLIFFHFSNFDHADPQYLKKRASCEIGIKYDLLEEIGIEYSRKVRVYENLIQKTPYSFDYMSNGYYISPTLRRAYVAVRKDLPKHDDPFDSNSVVMKFAQRNWLITKNKNRYKMVKNTLGARNEYSGLITFVNIFMKLILYILGSNKYQDFLKMLILLSSARINNNLWKK